MYKIITLLLLTTLIFSNCSRQVIISNNGYNQLLERFGISGSDLKDDTEGIENAIKSGMKYLYFPSGEYLISSSITLPNDIMLVGAPNAIFKATRRIDHLFKMDKPYHKTDNFQIQNIVFDGNNLADNCLFFYKLSYPTPAILRDVKCMNSVKSGVVFKACQIAKIDGLQSLNNGKSGVEFIGCNAMNVYGLSVHKNVENGITISGFDDNTVKYSGGFSLFGVHSEKNEKNGIVFKNVTTPISLFGGWIEANKEAGVVIIDSNVNLDGLRISGVFDVSKNIYPVLIKKNNTVSGSNVVIDNCMIVNDKGTKDAVLDYNKNSKKTIIRNLKKYNFIVNPD